MAPTLTTCTFCGTGCGIYLETAGNVITGAYASMSHPANKGRLSVRGWNIHEVASSPGRLMHPLIRRDGQFQKASWDEAWSFIATRLKEICAKHGPDSIAFLNSPRSSNEEAYLLQKFARAVVGTNNVDHGVGAYSNNSINVLKEMIGVPASTNSIGELVKSEVIVVDGVDLHMQMPTVGSWVLRAKLNHGAKLIVIDARRHRICEHADYLIHLRPGSDVFLYGAMAKVIVDRGLMNMKFIEQHCRGYEAFLEKIRSYDLIHAAENCGVSLETIEQAALAYARAGTASLLYSTGTEARDVETIQAMVNLVLLTGNIGKEGAGLFALTEQNNLQGVCDMGVLPDLLPGYVPASCPDARKRFETLWSAKLPAKPGLKANDILSGAAKDSIKALWLSRYDPVATAGFFDTPRMLKNLELVVVQHLFLTETAKYAHVILPVVSFGEERITFTSTERRIQIADKAIDPPEGPMPAWKQMTMAARKMGTDWKYNGSEDVMAEIGRAVSFYEAADYTNLQRDYGRQWPCTNDKPLGTRYLFEDGFPDKPFRFVAVEKPAAIPQAEKDFPMALVLGRSLYYWHHNVLIQHSETLKREYRMLLLDYPEGFVDVGVEDAKQLQIRDKQKIKLVSRTGSAVTTARVTDEVKAGMIFVSYYARETLQNLLGDAPPEVTNRNKPVHVRIEKA
ncbi:MAG: molybdopterin-dependent oxidoreductase [Verrucomicrobiae bacterium]|nr:molybdopterin-dependent oxidoreductase [Verrucomicrobiae bacterium]